MQDVCLPEANAHLTSLIQTLAPMQNASGGFGGSHGHASHCAPTYSAVLSLAVVGGTEALRMIDRESM